MTDQVDFSTIPPQVHFGVDCPPNQASPGKLLDTFMGFNFWRFEIVVLLSDCAGQCTYQVKVDGSTGSGAVHSFHLPAR
jgi:hypothetical protein